MEIQSKKIKIAFVIDTITDKIGGTERQLILLLEKINREKFTPYLCAFKDSTWLQENSNRWNTFIFNFTSFFSPISYSHLIRFAKYLKSENIDIVQTHFRDGNIVGILAAKLAGIPVIISSRRNEGYWLNAVELAVLKLLNPLVTSFLANSESIKKFVRVKEGVPEEKIEVIYNGFDSSKFPSKTLGFRKEYRQKLMLKPNVPIVIMVANLRPVKAIDQFLKSAQIVLQSKPDVHFLIVGDGPEKHKLQQLSNELNISKNVIFLGKRDDIPEILVSSDIGVLSSVSEGLSNSIIEYMAAGLPVVCTEVGGNAELVVHDVNGFLVPPQKPEVLANALLKLLDDPKMIDQFGKESLRRAHKYFSLEKMLERTENYYENLLNSHFK